LLPSLQPGPLAELLGAHVREFYALERPVALSGRWGAGEARIWGEWLASDAADVEVLARYGAANGWLDGQSAAVTRRVGAGRITYVGAWLDDGLMDGLARWLAESVDLSAPFGALPPGIEVCRRAAGAREVFVVLNHADEARQVALPRAMRDLLKGTGAARALSLAPRDVAVLVPAP